MHSVFKASLLVKHQMMFGRTSKYLPSQKMVHAKVFLEVLAYKKRFPWVEVYSGPSAFGFGLGISYVKKGTIAVLLSLPTV